MVCVESVAEFCTTTVKVVVSALLSGIINLWSMLEESTTYLVVINVPSNNVTLSKVKTLSTLDTVLSSLTKKL